MERIELINWKSKDEIEIKRLLDNYLVIEHRKNKETEEVKEYKREIPTINVEMLWKIIEKHCELNKMYSYRYLVERVCATYNLPFIENLSFDTMINAFNGGKYRSKYYFPFFYYPLKVLEYKEKIIYFGRGGIIRLC